MDIVEAMVQADDPANIAVVGHNITKSIRLMMFTNTRNAQWAADRFIKYFAYPFASLSFTANRNVFRYQVGDNFRWSSRRLNITNMVFRIVRVTEENLLKETIKIDAVEDVEYMAGAATFVNIPVGTSPSSSRNSVAILDDFVFMEAPYTLVENEIKLLPIVAKQTGLESGFAVYMSLTGDSYSLLAQVTTFAVQGTLVDGYTNSTYEIDEEVGFQVTIPNFASQLSSITDVELFGPTNLSLLGSTTEGEIITWKTITPVSGDIYEITGVYRNRYGSDRINHPAGTQFWFIGTNYTTIANENFTYGYTVYIKLVPYSGPIVGSISEIDETEVTFVGLSRRPYDPTNFGCNGVYLTPTYSGNCVLTWSPRVRGDGLGLGNPDYVVENPSHEGLFEVKVYVNGLLVRIQTAIDTDTWTYTASMNTADNGSLADTVLFRLRNYLTYESVDYTSAWVDLTVTKE